MVQKLAPTVAGLLRAQASRRADEVALRWRSGPAWDELTWGEYGRRAAALAAGLRDLGLRQGDRVLLMTPNSPAFHITDSALLLIGACPVSIHLGSTMQDIVFAAEHSEAVAAVIAGSRGLEGFYDALPHLAGIQHVLVADHEDDCATASWQTLVNADVALDDVPDTATPDDLATIIYTSGTTGRPKGVMISQGNVVWMADRMIERIGVPIAGWSQISYLPLAHLGERNATHYHHLRGGTVVYCCPDMADFFADLREVRPLILNAVPRIWEKLHNALLSEIQEAPEDEPHVLRASVGLDRCRLALSAGAPLNREVLRSLRVMGVPLSEGYGMTESAGPITWDPYEVRIGTAGRPLSDTEVRVDADGELLFRSGGAFVGYWKDPALTADTISDDGWVRTGDIASIDELGYVTIVDRKKELIVTSGGLNVSPSNIEGMLKESPLIDHACVVGDARRFVAALVALDVPATKRWLASLELARPTDCPLENDPNVRAQIQAWVDTVNERLRRPEQIKRFELVVDSWGVESGELTASLKLRRRVIEGRYATLIDRMYERPAGIRTD